MEGSKTLIQFSTFFNGTFPGHLDRVGGDGEGLQERELVGEDVEYVRGKSSSQS